MTWVEAIPGVTLLFGCMMLAIGSNNLHKRHRYRGFMDTRVPIHEENMRNNVLTRISNRDKRIATFKSETEWVHPLWKPQSEATEWFKNWKECSS